MLTQKEQREHTRLTRRILLGRRVTRAQVLRAFELKRKIDAERQSPKGE